MTPQEQHDAWERDGYPREWEAISDDSCRRPVPGGWQTREGSWDYGKNQPRGVALSFIPDPTHRWKLAD